MASIENISSLANINKDTIVDGAKALLASKKNELVDKFIEALQGRAIVESRNPNFRILLNDKTPEL